MSSHHGHQGVMKRAYPGEGEEGEGYGTGSLLPSSITTTTTNHPKKRKPNHHQDPASAASTITPVESITTARHLQAILADMSSPVVLQKGYQSFRNFLVVCSPERGGEKVEGGRGEADLVRSRAILREWIDGEAVAGEGAAGKRVGGAGAGEERKRKKKKEGEEVEEEEEGSKFPTLVKGLAYAAQSSNHYLLSSVASALALLVKTTSSIAAFNAQGAALIRVFLEPANMKIIYRGITAHQDRVSSPMLRLLTEMNKFNFGQMCPLLHAAFDFTVKDLGRNLESKKAESGTATAVAAREDPNKPTVRTVFIRFLLSFFQFGTPSVKGDVLGQRALISPMFKYIKSDPALLVHDILEVLKTKVVNDSMVPRAVKTQVFNEWVLGHISALYTRPEPLREDGDQNKTVAVCVHEFLITICTKPGIGGVCFPDNGWYPQGSEVGTSGSVGQDGEKRQGQKIHNRTLAAFITGLKPFADTLQQDLLLEIFAAAPELVAGYFTSSSGGGSFTFEPKLTATWIGYCTFLTGLVRLPLPKGGFGLEGESVAQANPPPATTIVESILPRPCTKQILAKCVTFDNALVRFLATKFVVSAFNKLKKVIDAMDHAAAGFADGSVGAAKWVSTKEQLVEEFSRRVPDMATIVAAYNSTPVIKTGGGLHREVTSRLLMQYYELLPEVALGKRFDVNIALGGFLESGEGAVEEAKGMRLLEMEHLLGIAKEAGDVKWWNKSANMPHSSFTQVLKLCLNKPTTGSTTSITTSSSLTRVKEVLRAVIDQTRLFQEETVASPFEALLESLDTAKSSSPIVFKHILTFLDDCLVRCVRTPFKYLDDFAELLLVVKSQAPLSPIVMTLGEQAKFILESAESVEVKQGVALWLVRFLENLALAGENPDVIVTVCERLDAMATAAGVTDVVAISRAAVLNLTAWSEGKPLVKASERLSSAFHGVRAVFPAPGLVDLEKADAAIASVQNAETVITTYDLSVILKALSILLGSATTSQVMIEKVMDLLEMVVLRGKTYQDRFVGDMKRLVSADEKIVWALLWKGEGEVFDYFVGRYINLLRTLHEDTYDESLNYFTNKASEAVELLCADDQLTDDAQNYKILSKYTQIIHSFFPAQKTQQIVTRASKITTKTALSDKLLAVAIVAAARKKISLDGNVLMRILSAQVSEEIVFSVGQYVATFPESAFTGLDTMGLESETGILHTVDAEEISHSRLTLVCELVRKVDGVRAWALEILKSAEQLSTITVSAIVRAVLDSLSTPKERKFQWKASVNDNTKQVIQNAISAKGDDLVQNGLENVDVLELFRKAASLFPTLNTTTILKQMLATDKKQKKDSHTNITPEAISFISSLIGKRSGKDGLDREKKAWYLVVVDHLTRRFGEEKVLTSKSAGEAKEFAELLRVNGVLLGKWVPRGSLNALLEAVVEKKIEEESAVALASVVVSQAEAAELDLAKLLQMILGNAKNPLATREAGSTTTIHYHMAYLIHRLFTFSKNIHSNITTMDSLMLLYRGTCSIVDRLILNMLMYIEGFLTRSCASRVATWTFLEDKLDPTVTSSSLLISRAKTKLAVNIDEKMLLGTVAEFAPEASMVLKEAEFDRLEEYLEAVKNQNVRFERQYDQSFMLPILAYVVSLQDKTLITAQAMVEKGALGYAVLGLCSQEQGVRRAATQLLSAIVARLEESTYKARNQITHLICALLASLEGSPLPTTPLPTVVGIFLAHAAQALTDPAHFLYEKLMELLLRSPLLDLWDIPYLLSVLGNEEDYYKEAIWKLTILAQGLRTPTDLGLYRKRRVVESVCAMYSNPYAGERTRERVLDLLWSLAEVGGGGETAVTRNGVVAWVEQQLVMKKEMAGGERAGWKVVVARLCEGGVVVAGGAGGAGGGHVREWSKGGLVGHLNEVFCS